MEHPTGKFSSALDAMTDAVTRLRALPDWKTFITFTAQGMGRREDSYAFSEVRILGDRLDFGSIAPDAIELSRMAGLSANALTHAGSGYVAVGLAPKQMAQLLDTFFRHYGGIRPFPDEGEDYAVGVEW
jgi:hypothetical protein